MKRLLVVALVCLLAPTAVSAQYFEPGPFRVSNIRVDATATYVTLSPAPALCGGGTVFGAHFAIQHSRANYQALYAMVLSAYTTGSRIGGVWSSTTGPCSNSNWLEVYMLNFEAKP